MDTLDLVRRSITPDLRQGIEFSITPAKAANYLLKAFFHYDSECRQSSSLDGRPLHRDLAP